MNSKQKPCEDCIERNECKEELAEQQSSKGRHWKCLKYNPKGKK